MGQKVFTKSVSKDDTRAILTALSNKDGGVDEITLKDINFISGVGNFSVLSDEQFATVEKIAGKVNIQLSA